jgi:hypothetical protein
LSTGVKLYGILVLASERHCTARCYEVLWPGDDNNKLGKNIDTSSNKEDNMETKERNQERLDQVFSSESHP